MGESQELGGGKNMVCSTRRRPVKAGKCCRKSKYPYIIYTGFVTFLMRETNKMNKTMWTWDWQISTSLFKVQVSTLGEQLNLKDSLYLNHDAIKLFFCMCRLGFSCFCIFHDFPLFCRRTLQMPSATSDNTTTWARPWNGGLGWTTRTHNRRPGCGGTTLR